MAEAAGIVKHILVELIVEAIDETVVCIFVCACAISILTLTPVVLNAAMDQVKVGLYVTDPHTDAILYMNKFMKDVFKLEHPEGKICWQVLQSGMNGRCPFCPVDRLMADANQNQVFRWEERNTLTWRIYDNSDSLMRWTDGSLVHLQQSVDITDSLRLHKEANYDELTGLLNRRAGKAALADALVRLDTFRPRGRRQSPRAFRRRSGG